MTAPPHPFRPSDPHPTYLPPPPPTTAPLSSPPSTSPHPPSRGTKCSFLVELQDMEVVLEVQLMHRAPNMAVSRDWSLQHVEVAHEGSGRTFYFMAGGWVGEAWFLWR